MVGPTNKLYLSPFISYIPNNFMEFFFLSLPFSLSSLPFFPFSYFLYFFPKYSVKDEGALVVAPRIFLGIIKKFKLNKI